MVGSHRSASHAASHAASQRRGLDVRVGVLDVAAWARWIEPVVARCTPLGRDQEPLLLLAEALADRRDADAAPEPALEALGAAAEALLVHVERAEDRGIALPRRADEELAEAHVFRQLRAALLTALLEHSSALGALLDGTPTTVPSASLHTRRSRLLYWLVTAQVPDSGGEALLAPHLYMPTLLAAEAREPLLSLLRGRWAQWPGFRPDQALVLGGLADRQLETVPLADWVVAPPERAATMAARLHAQLRRWVHLGWLRRSAPETHAAVLQAWQPALDDDLLRDYESVISSLPWDDAHEACWRFLLGEQDAPPTPCPVPWLARVGENDDESGDEQARAVLGALREVMGVLDAATRSQAGLYALFTQG